MNGLDSKHIAQQFQPHREREREREREECGKCMLMMSKLQRPTDCLGGVTAGRGRDSEAGTWWGGDLPPVCPAAAATAQINGLRGVPDITLSPSPFSRGSLPSLQTLHFCLNWHYLLSCNNIFFFVWRQRQNNGTFARLFSLIA